MNKRRATLRYLINLGPFQSVLILAWAWFHYRGYLSLQWWVPTALAIVGFLVAHALVSKEAAKQQVSGEITESHIVWRATRFLYCVALLALLACSLLAEAGREYEGKFFLVLGLLVSSIFVGVFRRQIQELKLPDSG